MVVDFNKIKTDILGDKLDAYILLFPTLSEEIKNFKAKPTCGTCERNIIPKIFADPEVDGKIKVIYGPDTTLNKTLPPSPPPQGPMTVINTTVPLVDYDAWAAANLDLGVRLFTPLYIPEQQAVKVFMMKMTLPQQQQK
jgi:hypothetical protein